MMYFISIAVISLFCLGWRTITDEGMIFYFLRRPFEGLHEEIVNKQTILLDMDLILSKEDKKHSIRNIRKLKFIFYIMKPFVLCITCMASVWGIPLYIYINGIGIELIPCIISASFIQTFIWNIHAKI